MKKKQTIAVIVLLSMSIIWGLSYIGIQNALNGGWGPFPILFVRTITGALCVLPFIFRKGTRIDKGLFIWGFLCALGGVGGLGLQAYGQRLTTVSATSFITSLYTIIVPILGMIFFKKRESWFVYLSCVIATIGCFLLNMTIPLSFDTDHILGNMLVLASTIFFALQIFAIAYASRKYDVLQLTEVELVFMAFISLVMMCIFGDFSFHKEGFVHVLWVGALSSGLCSVFQIWGQKYLPESVAGILMSLENVYGTIFAVIIFHESITWIQILGCILIFIPVILCQVALTKGKIDSKCKCAIASLKEDPPEDEEIKSDET